MPPKQKLTREEVINAAINLIRRNGITGITARGLGVELGCSSHPIFTVFQNMEEVQKEAIQASRAIYNGYVEKGLAETPAFKGVGMQYIHFAKEEPRLFELLFMTAGKTEFSLSDILAIDGNSESIITSIENTYKLSREFAYRLYRSMWIYTHGIACLCATGVSRLSEVEASELLTEAFTGILTKLKGEEK